MRMAIMAGLVTVGLDGSAESGAAAHWAAREALLREVPLQLVHAEEWASPLGLTPVTSADMRSRWAEALLRDAADELHDRHPELSISTRKADPKRDSSSSADASAVFRRRAHRPDHSRGPPPCPGACRRHRTPIVKPGRRKRANRFIEGDAPHDEPSDCGPGRLP
ncbi:universal stress protein [Streptomyces sp. NPDC093093]|uniref:universal stress protein n=1 Tax=Streptomyces sp. NPDC093093 TaxID=3366025 RepID=UPI00382BCF43